MTRTELSAAAEWRAHWPMVLTAMFGLSFASMSIYSIGFFIEPLTRDFGWSSAQVVAGFSAVALLAVLLSPFVGGLIDRYGSRRLAIPGIILSTCTFAAFGFATGSQTQWMVLWVIYACFALLVKATVWTAAVASVFNAGRGLALAVALSGAAVAQAVGPLTAQWLIDDYGWRNAFVWMGFGWGGFVLALVLPFFFDAHDHLRKSAAGSKTPAMAPILTGLTLREAMRNPPILRIAAALSIATFLGVGVTVHKAPILAEIGIARHNAAQIVAAAGIAGICGKLVTGWLLDRFRTGWINGICLALPAVALTLLLVPIHSRTLAICAMLIFGYSGGAYLQICTYLTSRYGGLRHFGKIFGVMASLMALGSALGPLVAGVIFDHFHNYWWVLIGGIPLGLCCGLLVAGLGPYPNWNANVVTNTNN